MAGCISGRRNRIAAATLLGALLGASAGFAASRATRAGSSKVTAVRFWSLGDLTRVAIEVSGDFKFRSERLPNPERLVFDIQGAWPVMVTRGMHVIPVNDALMKQMRVAETQPGVTRVVLDLEHPAEFTASQLANPNRLMIEVRSKAASGAPVGTSTTGAQKLKETPVRPVAPDLVARATLPSFDSLAATKRPAEDMKPAEIQAPRRFIPPPARQDPAAPLAKPVLSAPATLYLQTKPKLPAFSTSIRKDLPPPPSPAPVLIAKNTVPDPGPTLPPFSSLAESTPTRLPPPPSARIAEPKPLEIEAVPAKRNSNGDRSLTRVLGLKLSRVVLDAGHGGHDVGTHGPSGLTEKDLVLDVTKRLGELLEARLVREVIYTRTTDVFIPLEERPRIANTQKADLFLSIHANSSPIKSATGVETYYLNFTTSKAALDVAARENASSERSIFELKELLQKIALKDKIDESREFAGRLQTSLYGLASKNASAAAGTKNRGVKKAPFVVLIGAQMPAVLAEIGFLSNPAEEALLKKPEQRQKIAEALYKGIVAYVDTLSHPEQVATKSGQRTADRGQ